MLPTNCCTLVTLLHCQPVVSETYQPMVGACVRVMHRIKASFCTSSPAGTCVLADDY